MSADSRISQHHSVNWFRRALARATFMSLVCAVVLVGSAPAEAGPFDVGFCVSEFESECPAFDSHTFAPDSTRHEFQFERHTFVLTFEEVLQEFTLGVTANFLLPGEIPNNPSWQCVPYGPDFGCIEYFVEPVFPSTEYPVKDTHFTGPFQVLIAWLEDTDLLFPEARIFHAPAATPGEFGLIQNQLYASDIDDPGVRGDTDTFSTLIVGSQTVPEPGLLLLMGAGMGAAFLRRRRALRGHD